MKIAIFNQKGGVGKTTTAINIAAAITRQTGVPPLLFDMDPQAHLTRICGKFPPNAQSSLFGFFRGNTPLESLQIAWPGIGQLIPAHAQLVRADTLFGKSMDALSKLSHALDGPLGHRDVVFDCSPHLGVLSLAALFTADLVLIPVSADHISVGGAMQCAKTLKILEPTLQHPLSKRVLLTRFDGRRRMCMDILANLRTQFGKEMCATVIAENVALAESPAHGKDIFSYAPQSVGASCYARLYSELWQVKEETSTAIDHEYTDQSHNKVFDLTSSIARRWTPAQNVHAINDAVQEDRQRLAASHIQLGAAC